jgi:putative aldouronate transport system substrate-binding protein
VHVEIIQASSTNDAVTQFNLRVASDNLPDCAFLKTSLLTGGISSYIDGGTLIGLNDYMQYMPNLSAMYKERPEWQKQISTSDGIIYGIPKIKEDGLPRVTHGMQIRTDWLKNVNLSMPKTISDWDNVLAAFKEQDANGNGDLNDEIPLGTISYANLGQNRNLVAMFALAWGLSDTFAQRNNTVFFSPYEDEFKNVLAKLNEWYSKGYIDQDYLSLNEDAMNAKIMSNQVGAFAQTLGSGMAKFLSVWASEGLTYDLAGVPYPTANDSNKYMAYNVAQVIGNALVITSANKHPIETVKYFDYLFSAEGSTLVNYGIEGKSYTMVNGKPTYTDEIIKNPNGLAPANALYKYCFGLADFPGFQLASAYLSAIRWPQQIDAGTTFLDGIPINLLNLQHTVEETEAINKVWGDIETYSIEMINKYIMGTESLDTFSTFQETLKSMGIEEIIGYKQAAYDRSL